jgi:hypothetical protein
MTTKFKLDNGQESKIRRSPPPIDGVSFSCAGKGCATKGTCARWNRIYKEKYRNN